MTTPLSRVEAIARREADATDRPHVVLNMNRAGAPLYVCRELRDGIEADRIVSRFDPSPAPAASVVGADSRPASVVAPETLNVSIVRAALERAGLPADTDLPTAPRAYLDAYASVMGERRKEVFAAIEAAGRDASGMARHFVEGMAAAYARATAPRVATDGAGYQNTAQEAVAAVERPRPAPFAHAPYVEKLRFYQGLHAERLRPIPAADAASDYAAAVDFHAGEPAGLYPDPVTMMRNATAFRRGELLARCRKARAMMRGDAWQGDGPAMELAAAQAALWENRDERRAFIEAAARAADAAPVVEPVASVVGEVAPAPSNATEGASCEAAPAYLAIQCQREGHPRGTFLYQGNNWRTGRLVSPVFEDSVRLYQWATANGWHSLPYDPAHPVGVYAQPVQQAQSVVPLGGRYVPLGDGGVEWVADAPTMVPQPAQQQQAKAGATLSDAPKDEQFADAARAKLGDSDGFEVDADAAVSRGSGEPGGAFVACWVWVSNDEASA